MKVVRSKLITYLVLVIVMITYIVFIFNKNTDIKTKLDEVKLKTEINEISKNSFAIMVEKEDGSGYEEVDEFPLNYLFNEELSGCIDIDGKTIENPLSYDNGVVTVNVNSTAYCYLYFDYNPIPKEFTFYIGGNSNPEYVTSTNTTVYLSWEDTNITHYCVTNTQGSDNCTWNEVSGNSIDTSHTLTSGDGTKTVYAYLKNNVGNISPEVNDSIYLDSSAPTNNSVSINSGASTTNSTSVTLTLASTGATQMCISNTNSCTNWVTYATSKTHTLATGNGTKTVYVWYRDAAGNTSEYVTDTITLDTQAPTSNSVSINSGASSTTSTSVTLTLSSSGASQMCISNTSSCSSWETYATSKSWTLSSGNGTKTVYVWYKDAAGNTTSSYVTDTITLNFNAFGTYLRNTKTAGFNSTMEGGLYRYQGTTSVNNYVCFGTSNKDTCLGNTNAYMYRIIGVNSSGQVKLLKKEALNKVIQWHNNASANTPWPNSNLYKGLNGLSGNLFIGDTTYMPSGWSDKIATYSWKYGDITSVNVTASSLYNTENAWTQTVNAKIGLMYAHDYAYAYQSGGLNCSSSGSYSICKTSWMYLNVSDLGAPSSAEWTMSRWGLNGNNCVAWDVDSNGRVDWVNLINTYSVRPVFYLTTAVGYVSGSGTSSDPFIIS